jgi:hypothetical protein
MHFTSEFWIVFLGTICAVQFIWISAQAIQEWRRTSRK